MDVSAACSGFVYAYATASAYVTAGMARHVLVIGAELLTRFLDYTDRSTCILFGDGAGAVVVSASEEPAVAHGIEMTTDPSGAYMIWLPAGGSKSPPSAATIGRGEHFIRMEGKETYRFATKTLASTALAAIAKAGLTPDPRSTCSSRTRRTSGSSRPWPRASGLPMEKMFVNLDRYGNTSAASVPIALAEAVDAGRIRSGRQRRDRRVRRRLHVGRGRVRVDRRPGRRRPRRVHPAGIDPRPLPVDWDSVDPIPPQLAAVLAAPGPVSVPLDDVVPGDPPARATAGASAGAYAALSGDAPALAPIPATAPTEVSR
jgi:hypothetical protein